jgi:hypothetical protein
MGLTRKTMSLFTMGAVDFRSDKERTAAYTRGIRRQSRKQTQILKQAQIQQAVDDLHLKAAQREARRIVLAETRGQSKIPKQQNEGQRQNAREYVACAVGPCNEPRIDGASYCAKHGPKTETGRAKRKAKQKTWAIAVEEARAKRKAKQKTWAIAVEEARAKRKAKQIAKGK